MIQEREYTCRWIITGSFTQSREEVTSQSSTDKNADSLSTTVILISLNNCFIAPAGPDRERISENMFCFQLQQTLATAFLFFLDKQNKNGKKHVEKYQLGF